MKPLADRLAHLQSRQHAGGFTLLEILLVIVILAASAALIAPSFYAAASASVSEEARRLSLSLRLASDEAALSGQPMRWSATRHGYRFELPDAEGAWHAASEDPFGEHKLQDAIVIADVQPWSVEPEQDKGQADEAVTGRLLFMPEGIIQAAEIVLAREDAAGQRLTIQLRPGPAGIRVKDEEAL